MVYGNCIAAHQIKICDSRVDIYGVRYYRGRRVLYVGIFDLLSNREAKEFYAMKSAYAQYWGLLKFSFLTSVKLQGRLLVLPFVAAFWAIWKEALSARSEIDAYIAKEFDEEPCSGKH